MPHNNPCASFQNTVGSSPIIINWSGLEARPNQATNNQQPAAEARLLQATILCGSLQCNATSPGIGTAPSCINCKDNSALPTKSSDFLLQNNVCAKSIFIVFLFCCCHCATETESRNCCFCLCRQRRSRT